MIIATGMRLYGLDRQSLWYDEMVEERGFRELLASDDPNSLKHANVRLLPLHPFLIYLISNIFPGSDFALRILPMTFGILSVPLLFLFGRKLFNDKVGLMASFLLAISPFHIWYSQEARGYALQWMLALISLIYFVRALDQPNRNNFIGYTISTTAALYTHQLAAFLVILQFSYLLLMIQSQKKQLFKWAGAFLSIIVLYSPLVIFSLSTLMHKQFGSPQNLVNIMAIPYTIYSYFAGFSIGPSVNELRINQSLSVLKPYLTEIISIISIYGILVISGVWSARKHHSKLLLLILVMTVPIIGMFTLSLLKPTIKYSVRHTGIASFAFLLFIAKGMDWLSHLTPEKVGKTLMVIVLLVLTGFSTYSYVNYQFNKKYQKADIHSAVFYIQENRLRGDTVLCIGNHEVFNRYSKFDPVCNKLNLDSYRSISRFESEMQKIIRGKKRLWLVLTYGMSGKYGDYIKEWLSSNYHEIQQIHKGMTEIANVQVFGYDLTKTVNATGELRH